jgi:hypothetical protein
MTNNGMFANLRNAGMDKGKAVRTIAYKLYGAGTPAAAAFMAGYRDSVKYADGLEGRESRYSGTAAAAYSDGWTLAACVA